MDLVAQLRELAIGSRLRRLSDQIMGSGMEAYRLLGIDFDPKCFPVFYALCEQGEMAVTEIADALRLSHPAVIALARELEQRKLVRSGKDPKDQRRRLLSLSPKGKRLVPQLREAWQDITDAMGQMLAEAEHNLLIAIGSFEDSFKRSSLADRVKARRMDRLLAEVEVLDYQPEWAEHFKTLNYQWVEEYFEVEPEDTAQLEGHREHILDQGGCILFARLEGQIVGTCALVRHDATTFELAKMAVQPEYQGRQVGKKLGIAILERAERLGAQSVFLISNRKLAAALGLYTHLGFKEIPCGADAERYARCNIKMEIALPQPGSSTY